MTGKSRSGTAVRKRGKTRASEILRGAQRILISEGLANLSTRRVAEELGISVGHLAYYFPSKEELLQAMIESVIEGYDAEFAVEFDRFPDDANQRLEAVLRYMIEDSKRPEVQAFFYQFWGYSNNNEAGQVYRTRMYQHFATKTQELLRDVHPDINDVELDNMTYALLAFLEGLHVIHGTRGIDTLKSAEFDGYVLQQLLGICQVTCCF